MKIKHLFLLIFLTYCFTLNSQVINTRYIIDQTAIIFQRIVQTEDTIVTMGMGSTFTLPNYPAKLMFTKFNYEGEVLGYDVIIGDTLTEYFPLWSSSLRRKILSVGGAGESLTNESGFYAMYDLDNGLEWIKRFYPPEEWSLFIVSSLLLEDKIFLLAGQQDWNSGDIISTKLICTDLQGEVLWEKDFKDNNFNIKPLSILQGVNSSIILGLGKSNFPNSSNSSRSLIYKLDLEGNILSEWLNEEVNTFAPKKIIETEDEGLLFVGRYFWGYYQNGSSTVSFFQGNICKLDALGNSDWSIKTGRPVFGTDMNNLLQTMDGNYIAIGQTFDTLSGSGDYTESGHIIKFNLAGELIWEKRYYAIDTEGEYNRLFDIKELPDSSLIMCGMSTDVLGDFPQRGWLLKLDKNGNLENSVSILTPHRPIPKENPLHVFPNPTKGQVEVEVKLDRNTGIQQVELFDTSGRLLTSRQYKTLNHGSVLFDIPEVTTGMYIMKVNGQYVKKIFVE